MRVGSNDKPVRRGFSTNLYGEVSGMGHAYGLNTSHYFRILVLITMERPIFKVSWVVIDDMTGSCENLMQAIVLRI